MASLRFAQFSGEIPKLISRLLPDTGSQHAENVRLDDGGLTPVRKSRAEHTFAGASGIKTIYKHGSDWLYWTSVVNAAPGPVATDRLYYTGDGAPKMRVGTTVYPLAVTAPTAALTGSVSGVGSGDVVTRLYVYTWVTAYGEESEPNPISAEINWQAGQTVTLSGFQSTPAGRNITKQRIYRSQSSVQSGTDLFFLAERTASTSNFVDTYAPGQFGVVLPSKDWNTPPDTLAGLTPFVNGMMVAFSGKDLYVCEPFRPHAWPEKYVLSMDYDIVALGCFGSTIVVMTNGQPYTVTGVAPESLVQEKLEVNLPCINARGVVDLGYSVAYPSNDGLVVVGTGGATVASDTLFTRADWQRLYPLGLVSGQFAGRYFASYAYTELDGVTINKGTVIIDLTGQQPFILRSQFQADAFFYDKLTGALFFLLGSTVYEYDAIGQENEIMTWKSKRVVMAAPVSFGAILIESGTQATIEQEVAREQVIADIMASNAVFFAQDRMGSEVDGSVLESFALAGDPLETIQPDKFISVKVYADGKLIRTVSEMDKVKRINGNTRARVWEIQVNGTAEVEQVTLASTVRELNEVI